MGATSAIEWTEATWNPLVGCTKVSPGCDNCYAETQVNTRFHPAALAKGGRHLEAFPTPFETVSLRPDRFLMQPLSWATPKRVFVNSLSDLFHKDVPDEFIARVFAVMTLAPQHTFQLLTKRHGRMRTLLDSRRFLAVVDDEREQLRPGCGDFIWPLPNVWLGVSVENQQWADIRIPALLDTPAAVRWLSCEPLLGPVDLTRWLDRLDWVVVGGESGPGARPMHPDWARSLRDQCVGTKPAPRREQPQRAVGALPLDPNQERTNLSQEVEHIDLPGNVPGAERFRAATAGFDPVHTPTELGEPTNDVLVGVDDPHNRVTGPVDHNAALPQQEPGDQASVSVRVDVERAAAQRGGSADAEPSNMAADRVAVDVEQGRNLDGAHAIGVKLGNALAVPVEDASPPVGSQSHTVAFEQGSDRGGAAPVTGGDLIEARPAGVRSDDLISLAVEPVPDVHVSHDETIHGTSADQCVAAGVPYLFKQYGNWAPVQGEDDWRNCRETDHHVRADGYHWPLFEPHGAEDSTEVLMRNVGKKVAGRVLDGRTWSEYPHAR